LSTILLHILVESRVSDLDFDDLERFMRENFTFLKELILTLNFDIPRKCWIASRAQFNAECLFDYAVKKISNGIVLMLISEDIYIRDLNYVFGIGVPNIGSVISTFRLDNDIESLYKIILHEIGHAFGLSHCRSPCSMAPSNNIYDIYQIQTSYCQTCKLKLIK
jgi:archaemetzincin